jgi:uncharacterized protein (TIGR00369 family)
MSGSKTRSVEFQDPALTASGAVGKRGIEFLRDIIAGKLAAPPIQATLGFELLEVQDGFARFQLLPGEHLYGWQNAVHGGVAAALLDAAMGAAVMTVLDASVGHASAGLTVHLTRAITSRAGKVLAEGWVVHRGSRLVTTEGRLTDDQGRLLAHGSATAALVERPAT